MVSVVLELACPASRAISSTATPDSDMTETNVCRSSLGRRGEQRRGRWHVTRLRLAHMAGRRDPDSAIFLSSRSSSSRPPRLGRPSEPSLRDGFASPDPASTHQEIGGCHEDGGNQAPAGWAALV